jgi:hypothetical protein
MMVQSLSQVLREWDGSEYDCARIHDHAFTFQKSRFLREVKEFIDQVLMERHA